jgi:hypothetical protein
MRLHVSFPDLCNELSESINELSESIRGTVSDVSACVTDSSKAGFKPGGPNPAIGNATTLADSPAGRGIEHHIVQAIAFDVLLECIGPGNGLAPRERDR